MRSVQRFSVCFFFVFFVFAVNWFFNSFMLGRFYLFIYLFFFLFVVVVETVGIKVTLTQQMRLTRSGRIAAASFLPAANC